MIIVRVFIKKEVYTVRVKIILIFLICYLKAVDLTSSISAFATYQLENNSATKKCGGKPWRQYNIVDNISSDSYEQKSGYLCCQNSDCSDIPTENSACRGVNCVCNGDPSDSKTRCAPFESIVSTNDCIKNANSYDFIYLTKGAYCCDLTSGSGSTPGCVTGYLQDNNGTEVTGSKCTGTCACSKKDDSANGYCYIDKGNSRGVFILGMPAIYGVLTGYQKIDLTYFDSYVASKYNVHAEGNKLKDIKNFITTPPHQVFTFSSSQFGNDNNNNIKCGSSGSNSACCGTTPTQASPSTDNNSCCGSTTCLWKKLNNQNVGNWYDVAEKGTDGKDPIFKQSSFCISFSSSFIRNRAVF